MPNSTKIQTPTTRVPKTLAQSAGVVGGVVLALTAVTSILWGAVKSILLLGVLALGAITGGLLRRK